MKADARIDEFIEDMVAQGRLNSPSSERSYRIALRQHGEDLDNRDPRNATRDHVKSTLRRWSNPNTQGMRRAILVSFYDWMMEEGYRKDNPARQTRRPKRKRPTKYRMTSEETRRLLRAAETQRERLVVYLGSLAGLRRAELRGLQGRHFTRAGFIWVSDDIGKGKRERWIPVLAELEPIVAWIQEHIELDAYVIPAQRIRDPGTNLERIDYSRIPCSPKSLYDLVQRVGARAGIAAPITPHTMRHAFADHVADQVDVRTAQWLLGHSSLATTEEYLRNRPRLDDLTAKAKGINFGIDPDRLFAALEQTPEIADLTPSELELVLSLIQRVMRPKGISPTTPNKFEDS